MSITRSPDQPQFVPADVRKAEFLLPYLINTFETTMLFAKINGERYLKEVVEHYVSGQMKVALEHTEDGVLRLMRKPGTA